MMIDSGAQTDGLRDMNRPMAPLGLLETVTCPKEGTEMTLSSEDREALLGLLSDLTPGHVSTLVASLGEPDSQIGTSTDSESFAFLRRMADLGLAEEVPLQIDLPPEIRDLLSSFSLNEAGRNELELLLRAASRSPRREG